MADTNTPSGENSAASPDKDITIPRISLTEQGFVGLKSRNGQIYAEANAAFQYPAFIRTVNEVRNNPTVGGAMNVYRMMISRVNWRVEPPKDASDIEKERARLVSTMTDDMEGSWKGFIEEVVPYLEYGFGIHEKVLRRRLFRNGSKYNDGLVGIKKLAPRNQDTIEKWIFDDSGSNLLGVQQNISNVENSYRYASRKDEKTGLVPIDREKFLLFTASGNKGNPQGNSLYKSIYLAVKTLSLLQESELIGISKDVQGILKITIPPKYLDPAGSDADKATVAAFQQIIDNYNAGTQRGLLVPGMYDEGKNPLFTYDLMEAKGSAKYDVENIIKRLQSDVLSALSVDVLKMGADGGGSFSLAESKTSILTLAIDYRLREIATVLNEDLMSSIYSANGWSQENMAKFVYEDIEDINLSEFAKAVQQIFSVGGIEMDRPVMNRIRRAFGVAELPDDKPVDKEELSTAMAGVESNAGEGMQTAGEGTSKSPMGKGDASAANVNNK
jgi:hypothetical protein